MKDLEIYRKKKRELRLTNEKISDLSGIPKRTIEDFFRGAIQDPRSSTLEGIERALGMIEEGYRDTMPVEITPLEDELLALFRELSDEDKQLVVIFLRKLNK